ncbi:MAG TPA: hypothetical protein VGB14_16410 [Acidimicrobiales bacterium]|jgi:hypothetical protein
MPDLYPCRVVAPDGSRLDRVRVVTDDGGVRFFGKASRHPGLPSVAPGVVLVRDLPGASWTQQGNQLSVVTDDGVWAATRLRVSCGCQVDKAVQRFTPPEAVRT